MFYKYREPLNKLGLKIIEVSRARSVANAAAVILFLFCMGINIHLRLFPAYFPRLKLAAKVNVENKMRERANNTVAELYPDYNPYAKEALYKELLKRFKEDKKQFRQDIRQEYDQLKSKFQDDRGQTYLLELDPYQWLRNTENVLKYGHPGDKKVKGVSYDSYMLAPVGHKVPYVCLLFYSAAFLYKIFIFFFPAVTLAAFLFYLPLFYSAVFLSLLYFFTRRIFSSVAAFFTTLFVGLNHIFLHRSCAGWFDYDILSLIMPLLIVWFIVEALADKSNIKKVFLFSFLASLIQGIYPLAWIGWWFIFIVISGFFFCSILNNYLIAGRDLAGGNRENQRYFIAAGVFILGSVIFCFLFAKENLVSSVFGFIKQNLHLGKSTSFSIWPNTFYTVGELRPANIGSIADSLFGKLIFMLSLVSMFLVYVRERRGVGKDIFYIMFFWFAFMMFASLRGVRFIIYLAIPLGFFLGGFMSRLILAVREKLSFPRRLRRLARTGVILFSVLVLGRICWAGLGSAQRIYPMLDDNWVRTLKFVKENTPDNAILNSWWDYGDFFKALARRRVLFDGQSQQRPIAYWIARALLSKDEEEAVRILRMLNNASDTTFDVLHKHIPDSFRCLTLLEEMFSLPRAEAQALLLAKGLPAPDVGEILDQLYNEPAPAYFVVDKTMLEKMPAISFIGTWDFKKLYIFKNFSKPKEEIVNDLGNLFGLPAEDARKYYDEIIITPSDKRSLETFSRRLSFYAPPQEGKREGNILYFDNGLVYDLKRKQAIIYSFQNKAYKKPKKIFLSEENKEKEIIIEGGEYNIGIWVFLAGGKYQSLVLDEPLINSLFCRLYFLEAKGLKYFEPFLKDTEADIYIYKINWNGKVNHN